MSDGVVKIHGKSYRTVARRVADFRLKFPPSSGWAIDTKIENINDGSAIVRATIIDPEGRAVATGLAQDAFSDSSRHKTSWLEIAETSAVGRALAFFSIETMGDELQIASAEEVENAQAAAARVSELKVQLNQLKSRLAPAAVDRARSIASGGSVESLESALEFMRKELKEGGQGAAPDIAETLVNSWRKELGFDVVAGEKYDARLEALAEYFQGEIYDFADMDALTKGDRGDRVFELERLEAVIGGIEGGEKR